VRRLLAPFASVESVAKSALNRPDLSTRPGVRLGQPLYEDLIQFFPTSPILPASSFSSFSILNGKSKLPRNWIATGHPRHVSSSNGKKKTEPSIRLKNVVAYGTHMQGRVNLCQSSICFFARDGRNSKIR